MSSLPTTTTANEARHATDHLRGKGVVTFVAEQLAKDWPPSLIVAWCEYADRQTGMGPGALIEGIKTGQQPPSAKGRAVDGQREYGERIVTWLQAKLPDVCRQSSDVIEATRRVFGARDADRLAAWTGPHPAAVAAVIGLHHRLGRGRLTVREHGPEIRAAVKAADERAVADLERIEKQTSSTVTGESEAGQ